MIKGAIEKILSLGGSKLEVVDGRNYEATPTGYRHIMPPKADTLEINTLTGIVDYDVDFHTQMVHVVSNRRVDVTSLNYSDAWLTRSTYLTANHDSPSHPFGHFLDVEAFIINMQALFVQDEQTAAILKIVGNIKDEAVSSFSDDGITQAVTAKAGISLVEQVRVPNPVVLRPYRTFIEVEQPASSFVFRMKSGKGEPPKCALFEADGMMWKLEAIQNIKAWLVGNLPYGIKIIA